MVVIVVNVQSLIDWSFSRELLSFGARRRRFVGNVGSISPTTLISSITVLINLFGYFINLFG